MCVANGDCIIVYFLLQISVALCNISEMSMCGIMLRLRSIFGACCLMHITCIGWHTNDLQMICGHIACHLDLEFRILKNCMLPTKHVVFGSS